MLHFSQRFEREIERVLFAFLFYLIKTICWLFLRPPISPPRLHKAQFGDNERNAGHNMFQTDNIDSRLSPGALMHPYVPAAMPLPASMAACWNNSSDLTSQIKANCKSHTNCFRAENGGHIGGKCRFTWAPDCHNSLNGAVTGENMQIEQRLKPGWHMLNNEKGNVDVVEPLQTSDGCAMV